MPENEISTQGVEQIGCSSCGAVVSPEDVSEGRARQIGGEMLCASCVQEQMKAGAVTCKQCGNTQPPLFDGRRYLCRNCGAALAEGKRAGTVRGKAPRASAMKEYLIGAAVGAVAFAAVVLVVNSKADAPGTQAEPEQSVPSDDRFNAFEKSIMQAVEANLLSAKQDMKDYEQEIKSAVVQAITQETSALRLRVAALEKQLAARPPASAAAAQQDPVLAEILAAVRKAKEDTAEQEPPKTEVTPGPGETQGLPAGTPTVTVEEENIYLDGKQIALEQLAPLLAARFAQAKPEDRAVKVIAKAAVKHARLARALDQITRAGGRAISLKMQTEADDNATAGEEKAPTPEVDETKQAVAKLKEEARQLARQFKFAEALAKLDSRPDIRHPIWQADREKAKQEIRNTARDLFRLDLARVDEMLRGERYPDAREVLRQITEYGLSEMVKEAKERLVALDTKERLAALDAKNRGPEPEAQPQKESEPPPVNENEDPRVRQYMAHLRDKDAAQHVRTRAAKELGVLRAKAAVDDLINAMDDLDWYLRVCAAGSLEQIGDVRAVPALIRNLKHPMIPVAETAKKALIAITGQDLGKDAEKWQEWWETTGSEGLSQADREKLEWTGGTGEVIEVEAEPDSFNSQILIYQEEEQSVTFHIKANSGLKVGQKVKLTRDGAELASVEIAVIGFGSASGSIVKLSEDAAIKAGDMVTVEK